MSVYQFYTFQFNGENYQLSKNDKKVSIRPKTALLLNYLIKNRQVIISKDELFQAVWQTTHVQNHTLFQVISEIRKLTNEDLVRTQPNRGYQWVAPTKEITIEQSLDTDQIEPFNVKTKALRKNSGKYLAMVASISMLACVSFYLGQWSTQKSDVFIQDDIAKVIHDQGDNSLPAINAYAKGVIAFEQGNYSQAKQWFDFSLLEDPNSVPSKLMLAESYFKQENYTRAQDVAFKLLDTLDKSSYQYSSAANLMSRMYAQQGLVFDALNYAITGANSLENSTSFCSIEVSEQRIGRLVQRLIDDKSLQTDKEKLLAGYYKKAKQNESSSAEDEKKTSTANTLCEHANKIKESTKSLINDVSACLKQENTPGLLSYNSINRYKVHSS